MHRHKQSTWTEVSGEHPPMDIEGFECVGDVSSTRCEQPVVAAF